MGYHTGTGASLQIGKESTFASAVQPSALVNLTSESIKVSVEKSDEGSLLASKTPMSRDLLGITVDGSVSFVLRPEFAGLLFFLSLGQEGSVTTSGGKHKHTFTLARANQDLPSATIVVDRKVSVKKYAGVTISTLTLECPAGDYVKGSFDLKGTKEESGSLNPSLTGFTIPSYRCTSATFKVGGSVLDISSSTLKIENSLEDAPKTYSSGLYKGQPIHGRRNVTLDFDIPYSDDIETFKETYLPTENLASIELTFCSSNEAYTVKVVIPNLSIMNLEANVGDTGLLTASGNGEALSIGSTEPITIEVIDDEEQKYGD